MALQKTKILNNGVEGNYWVAEPRVNIMTNKTDIIMYLFKDKATRDNGKSFIERVKVPSLDGIYLTGQQVYSRIKTSNIQSVIKDVPLEKTGENGYEPEYENVETNWFANAEDC